jgi:hypothetical protein
MFKSRISLKLESGTANQHIHSFERESLPPLQSQKGFPDQTVVIALLTHVSRNSKLVGFERGCRPLQPFWGYEEF